MVELCQRHYPGRAWNTLSAQEQVVVIRDGLRPRGVLIDPHCPYMKYWDLMLSICLIFTGVVTPYEVIFMGALEWYNPLFIVERFVDLVFIKDMILQFFLMVEVAADNKRGTVLLKDAWTIRRRYLWSWFPIDFISVLQFDVFFMLYKGSDGFVSLKFMRMARLVRLVKLLRMLRTSRLVLRWQSYSTITFGAQKLMKFCCGLLLASHWMACAWGLVGKSVGMDLCDESGNRLPFFSIEDIPIEKVSWITALFVRGKYSPDDPCNPWHVYCASLHWAVMTITSIGYGDIVPVRSEEYLACVACMLIGGVVWANVIGGTCAIIAKGDPVQARFEANTDLLNAMMKDTNFPVQKHQLYREYLREAKACDTAGQFRGLASRFSPLLKGDLLLHSMKKWIEGVFYLPNDPKDERVKVFQMALADALSSRFYSRKETATIPSAYLCIVERGTVARGGKLMTPGQAFQIDFIVSNPALRKVEETMCLTYALLFILHRTKFFALVDEHPVAKEKVRMAAFKLALIRCIKMCANVVRPKTNPWFNETRTETANLYHTFLRLPLNGEKPQASLAVTRQNSTTEGFSANEVRKSAKRKRMLAKQPADDGEDELVPEKDTMEDMARYIANTDLRRWSADVIPTSPASQSSHHRAHFDGTSPGPTLIRGNSMVLAQDAVVHTADGDIMERRLDALEAALTTSQTILANAMEELRMLREERRDRETAME